MILVWRAVGGELRHVTEVLEYTTSKYSNKVHFAVVRIKGEMFDYEIPLEWLFVIPA